MVLKDYKCKSCETVFEALEMYSGEPITCPECSGECGRIYIKAPSDFKVIVPDYPGAKKRKAGYQHTHVDRPKTKTQIQGFNF
jgi:putative FmdB family regulatory protein